MDVHARADPGPDRERAKWGGHGTLGRKLLCGRRKGVRIGEHPSTRPERLPHVHSDTSRTLPHFIAGHSGQKNSMRVARPVLPRLRSFDHCADALRSWPASFSLALISRLLKRPPLPFRLRSMSMRGFALI